MFNSVIISGELAQDHEFIYPFYRLLEERSNLDVCIIGGKSSKGIMGTNLPPNKDHPVKDISQLKVENYDLLVLPGGVKAMEKIRQNKILINFISDFYNHDNQKIIACICSGAQLLISANIINAGAIYTDEEVVYDQRIFTTAHYKDMGPWMKAAIDAVKKNIK